MGFLYLAYAGRSDTLKEIPPSLRAVYIAGPLCCK